MTLYTLRDKPPLYLGDAVYAEIRDGLIALRLNDHRSAPLIFLEPEVYEALKLYVESAAAEAEGHHE